ncbi:Ribose-5-phosphate isomerase A [Buchnera aphidicola (Chaitophorus sp. 3695)]|uniref:ribose-5-phosphate isomerase RpiA n=1 Tax=Buchnera aphidicola TaxID=9 RepID=UPI003463CF16
MTLKNLKKIVAKYALRYIPKKKIIGIGTGSTISYFIKYLRKIKDSIQGAVSSSNHTTISLKKNGIPVIALNDVDYISIYFDSADEINNNMDMIKGGGAALMQEKIIASASKKFVCMIDYTKKVNVLGKFPLPIEVLPMSYKYVKKELEKLGGIVKKRKKVITDNNNYILDIKNLYINNPIYLEKKINNIPGVISVGIFSQRQPDILLISNYTQVQTILNKS